MTKEQYYNMANKHYADQADTIDLDAEYDPALTMSENEAELLANHPVTRALTPRRPTREELERLEDDHQEARASLSRDAPLTDMMRGAKVVALSGGTGSGKTALAYRCLDALASLGKVPHVYKHPLPRILPRGYVNVWSLGELEQLHDCALYIDEPQIALPRAEHHAGTALMNLLALCRQLNITVILSTSDSRYFTKSIEAYIDCYIIKDQEAEMVKQGSMIKKIIKDNVFIDISGFKLTVEEFLFYSRSKPQLGGKHRAALPSYWTIEHSTPYKQR